MEDLAPEDLVDDWSDLSTSSLGAGARLGRYELLLPVAYGGMARVWAARLHGQRGFSKTVAIKTILPHLAHSAEFERMFLDEARIASGVHHPNVIEIYELGEEGHVLYLAMEWVNGDSLVHVLRGSSNKAAQAVEVRLAARIVADACAGLHAAHELTDEDGRTLEVVHRDVSPHNILVSLEGTVKVTDFGVAKAFGQSHQATVAGQVKGKVAYMAPEQIGGTTFDRRADIFGMGCVLYEAATGAQPFRGANDPQIMQAVLRGAYEPPSALVPGFPPELATIIDSSLAAEPSMRFATAERMRVALEEWLAKSGPLVTPTQVGALVRQRLGPALEKRREHVKAAMGSGQADSGSVRAQGQGHTPPEAQPGQSHSGVMPTGQPVVPAALAAQRARAPSLPNVIVAPPPPASGAPAPSVAGPPPPLPPAAKAQGAAVAPARASSAPPSGAKYVLAALGGVVFALCLGGGAVAAWFALRPSAPATAVPEATALPPAGGAPVAPMTTAPASVTPPASAAPSDAPATIDVSQLPPARPTPTVTWQAPAARPASRPSAAPAAPPPAALPANPY